MKDIPLINAMKIPRNKVVLDPAGFFVIEVNEKEIRVEYYSNVYKEQKIVSGILQKVFIGKKAAALSDSIATHVPPLRPEHYLYLGRELMCAQQAFDQKTAYEQGGC